MKLATMLDLETWGTEPDAPIISIGAVRYDIESFGILAAFHVGVDPRSSMGLGAKPSADTLLWWMHPDRREALDAWLGLQKVDLATALFGFASWYVEAPPTPVYGNGATFDNVLMRRSFGFAGIEHPWPFWKDLCFRTIKTETVEVPALTDDEMQQILPGVAHDALFDATRQALHHQRIHDYHYPRPTIEDLPDGAIEIVHDPVPTAKDE